MQQNNLFRIVDKEVESFLSVSVMYSGGLIIYLSANLGADSRIPNEPGRDIGVEYFPK